MGENYEYNKAIELIQRTEFTQLQDVTYLDHAGTTLFARSQIEGFQRDMLSSLYGNPHSRSHSSHITMDTVDQIRYRVLQFFNATDDYHVVFTSGCTAALKIIAECFDFKNESECNFIGTENVADNFSSVTKTGLADSEVRQKKLISKGCFCYTIDNHTSVQGMREFAYEKAASVVCLHNNEVMSEDVSELNKIHEKCVYKNGGNCLFVYPAQSNFSGKKYPLEWIEKVKNSELPVQSVFPGRWYTLLDAAAFVSTSHLDLKKHQPDFVPLSFYKMFGFPTGLGALLVHKSAVSVLKKRYYGGGSILVSTARERFHVNKKNICDSFENGTIDFLNIIALRYGFEALDRLGGGIACISPHVFHIAQYFYKELRSLCHRNDRRLAEFYCDSDFSDIRLQGPVVNFNLIRADGEYIGFAEVDKLAELHSIQFRTGCFCNIGACEVFLGMSEEQIKYNYQTAGHVCGDDIDLVDGKPTGSVRISFGYMSVKDDARRCLQFIVNCFLECDDPKPVYITKPLISQHICDLKGLRQADTESLSATVDANGEFKDTSKTSSTQSGMLIDDGPSTDLRPKDRYLSNIFLFPVKSCAAFEVMEWDLGPRGLKYDRDWMVVSDAGIALGQKRESKLCLVQPTINLKTERLILTFPGMLPLSLPLDSAPLSVNSDVTEATLCTSKVCGDRVNVIDCGQEASDWLSQAFDRPGCRLIQQAREDDRRSKLSKQKHEPEDGAKISLANQSQFLLLNRASVDALRTRMENDPECDEQLPDKDDLVLRFRGNIVIAGGEPFEEEICKKLEIGDKTFLTQTQCSRCQMICANPKTGERSKEPLRTLAAWRGKKIPFGVHTRYTPEEQDMMGRLKVGDRVHLDGKIVS